jgi:hypothetical protein
MLFGNVYYAWQAARMSRITGRKYTAQPYGVHTIAGFAYVYGIMVPVYLDQVRDVRHRPLSTPFIGPYLPSPLYSCKGPFHHPEYADLADIYAHSGPRRASRKFLPTRLALFPKRMESSLPQTA